MPKLNERRKQIQEYNASEARRELKELRVKLFNLRLQQQRGEVKNNRVFMQTRKDIARLLHRLTQLEAGEKKHRIYKRTYKQTKHFHAHDEENTCQVGDMVRIEECRPLSKLKRWRLGGGVKRGSGIVPVAEVLAEADPDLTPSAEQTASSSESSEE